MKAMSDGRLRLLAGSLWVLSLLLGATVIVLTLLTRSTLGVSWDDVVIGTCFPTVGVLAVRSKPKLSIAWLLLVGGLFSQINVFSTAYGFYTLIVHPGALPLGPFVGWLSEWSWVPSVASLAVVLPLLYPTGSVASARWTPVLRATIVLTVLATLLISVLPFSITDERYRATNPFEVSLPTDVLTVVGAGLLGGLLVLAGLAVASLVSRMRSADGVERQQIKWFACGTAILVLTLVVSNVTPALDTISMLGVIAVCIALGVSILRYRLYEIDAVINKTLVFGALAGFISAVYIAVVVGVGELIGSSGRPNLALSIAATAIVALAFQPVRGRVQRFANRLVYGERATPYEIMSDFGHKMAAVLSVDEVLPRMVQAAARGVDAARARALLLLPDGAPRSAMWPPGEPEDARWDLVLEVQHEGEHIGELAVAKKPGDPLTAADHNLLTDLAAQAALALRNARLAAELRSHLDQISRRAGELAESRERIVTAADESRRRLEHDINEGPARRLTALETELARAETSVIEAPVTAAALLDEVAGTASRALDELRELARGVYPALLADRGVAAALEAHADKLDLPVSTQIGEDMHSARFDQPLENAVYFLLVDALGQLSGQAESATVALRHDSGRIEASIEVWRPGVVLDLRPIRDRVESVGGTVSLAERPQGVLLEVRVAAQVLSGDGALKDVFGAAG